MDTARHVVDTLRTTLGGLESDGVRVHTVLHYGAVDISPSNLVVWILLAGKSDEQLPEWTAITETGTSGPVDHLWLSTLRTQILALFDAAHWPDPDRITVLTDSAHRVDANGGWRYFK